MPGGHMPCCSLASWAENLRPGQRRKAFLRLCGHEVYELNVAGTWQNRQQTPWKGRVRNMERGRCRHSFYLLWTSDADVLYLHVIDDFGSDCFNLHVAFRSGHWQPLTPWSFCPIIRRCRGRTPTIWILMRKGSSKGFRSWFWGWRCFGISFLLDAAACWRLICTLPLKGSEESLENRSVHWHDLRWLRTQPVRSGFLAAPTSAPCGTSLLQLDWI